MSKIVLIKGDTGKLEGQDPISARAYEKFKRTVDGMSPGDTMAFSFKLPRSISHHGLFFAKLTSLLARTERFEKLDGLRYWLTMGAGYVDYVPGKLGKLHAIPLSIQFESMDEAEFQELHRAIDDFLWTPYAQAVLWPQLSEQRRHDNVQSFMDEFAK